MRLTATRLLTLLLATCLALSVTACSRRPPLSAQVAPGALLPSPTPTLAAPTPLPASTATPTPTLSPSPTPPPTPVGPLVAIDAGHGGEDLGACHVDLQGRLVLTESEANLAIALKVRDALVARGVRVYMLRTTDTRVNTAEEDVNGNGVVDFRDDVQARVDAVNAAGAELLVSIHQNAYYYGPGILARDVGGTVTYYCPDRPHAEASLRLASLVQSAVVQALADYGYGSHDRGVRPDDELGAHLILLGPETDVIARTSTMPAVLNETLFVTHDEEVRLLADEEAQKAVAEGYAEAIVAFLSGEPGGEAR